MGRPQEGHALAWIRCFAWLPVAIIMYGAMAGCNGKPSAAPVPQAEADPAKSPFAVEVRVPSAGQADDPPLTSEACPQLRDVHADAAIDFVYANGAAGDSLMVESIGGGAGWLDYDGDRRWDLYFAQGGNPLAATGESESNSTGPNDRLYRNRGDGTFEDRTDAAGIADWSYGQGVAIGDFDGDGFDDIYVTNYGRNSLFHNQGDGTFLEVAQATGVGDPRWSSSAAWADLDRDGDLDLYVANYCDYDVHHPVECKDAQGRLGICHPSDVPPAADECYINQGDGTFLPEAGIRGLYGPNNRALGVAVADFSNDGLPDIYVANDTTENFLFINQGDGQFRESAGLLGCAVDHRGHRQASMGLAVGDFDENGFLDIYSTHYFEESNTLYRNLGPRGFEDVTGVMGLHAPTFPLLGFGTVMADLNQDGHPDLFVTNGHIDSNEKVYAMRPQLFTFLGRQWSEASSLAGPFFQETYVGRGVAACDYDDDGDLDLLVVHQNEPAALLRNDSRRGNWLQLRFLGKTGNRRGIGVRATVLSADRQQMQQLCGGTSFASTHAPMLNFGLGENPDPVTIEVDWPSGTRQTLRDIAVDQTLTIVE